MRITRPAPDDGTTQEPRYHSRLERWGVERGSSHIFAAVVLITFLGGFAFGHAVTQQFYPPWDTHQLIEFDGMALSSAGCLGLGLLMLALAHRLQPSEKMLLIGKRTWLGMLYGSLAIGMVLGGRLAWTQTFEYLRQNA